MGKKCVPGMFCIENMTLFMLFIVFLLLIYMYYNFSKQNNNNNNNNFNRETGTIINIPPRAVIGPLQAVSTRNDSFNDPYSPPLKTNEYYQSREGSDIRPRPNIPIQTQGPNSSYTQVGILTRSNGRDDMILPLMGRRNYNGRDKWQYYTISNTGNMNTKLPVSVNGRSCTGDNGCDEIYNNDSIYVEGYKDVFVATIYETGSFSYNAMM
jgi:hypothetical protein